MLRDGSGSGGHWGQRRPRRPAHNVQPPLSRTSAIACITARRAGVLYRGEVSKAAGIQGCGGVAICPGVQLARFLLAPTVVTLLETANSVGRRGTKAGNSLHMGRVENGLTWSFVSRMVTIEPGFNMTRWRSRVRAPSCPLESPQLRASFWLGPIPPEVLTVRGTYGTIAFVSIEKLPSGKFRGVVKVNGQRATTKAVATPTRP